VTEKLYHWLSSSVTVAKQAGLRTALSYENSPLTMSSFNNLSISQAPLSAQGAPERSAAHTAQPTNCSHVRFDSTESRNFTASNNTNSVQELALRQPARAQTHDRSARARGHTEGSSRFCMSHRPAHSSASPSFCTTRKCRPLRAAAAGRPSARAGPQAPQPALRSRHRRAVAVAAERCGTGATAAHAHSSTACEGRGCIIRTWQSTELLRRGPKTSQTGRGPGARARFRHQTAALVS